MLTQPKGLRRAALFGSAALILTLLPVLATAQEEDDDDDENVPVTELVITARRLDAAQARIEPALGAASYALSNETVEHRPSGETISINESLLQAPGVAQDGGGQLHVRGSTGDLQYRINNVIIPEGTSDLGETLTARIAQRIELVSGTLPAQYGLQVGGVVNIITKSGVYLDGTQFEVMRGSHGELEPAFEHGGSSGRTNYFLTGRYRTNAIGLPPPEPGKALHDRTQQYDAFAIVDHIKDDQTRLSFIAGASDQRFQIPNRTGVNRDDARRERSAFAVGSYFWVADKASIQASAFLRASSEQLDADGVETVRRTGLGVFTRERQRAAGAQVEGVFDVSEGHTLRAGAVVDRRQTKETGQFLTPFLVATSETESEGRGSVFLQDEWRPMTPLTINLGARLDAVDGARKVSPRASMVWATARGATLHVGYARYYLPAQDNGHPPTALFIAALLPPSSPVRAERDDYFDIGVEHKAGPLTVGLDAYRRDAAHLLDQSEYRVAGLAFPFNYARGRIQGLELSATYAKGPLSAWANLAAAKAEGRDIESNQGFLSPVALKAAARDYVRLSHSQTYTASGGASYRTGDWRVATSFLYGSGFRRTPPDGASNSGSLPSYLQVNLAVFYRLEGIGGKPLELRFNMLNAFDEKYLIRDGTEIGGLNPQWGARRAIIVGFEQAF